MILLIMITKWFGKTVLNWRSIIDSCTDSSLSFLLGYLIHATYKKEPQKIHQKLQPQNNAPKKMKPQKNATKKATTAEQ